MKFHTEDVVRNLLHSSLLIRKKGSSEFIELLNSLIKEQKCLEFSKEIISLREILWKAIEYEDDSEHQAKLIKLGIQLFKEKSLNKLIRFSENNIILINGNNILARGFHEYYTENNLNSLHKSVLRDGSNIHKLISSIFSNRIILDEIFISQEFWNNLLNFNEYSKKFMISNLITQIDPETNEIDFKFIEFRKINRNYKEILLTNVMLIESKLMNNKPIEKLVNINEIINLVTNQENILFQIFNERNYIGKLFSNLLITKILDIICEDDVNDLLFENSVKNLFNLINKLRIQGKRFIIITWLIHRYSQNIKLRIEIIRHISNDLILKPSKSSENVIYPSSIDKFLFESISSRNSEVRLVAFKKLYNIQKSKEHLSNDTISYFLQKTVDYNVFMKLLQLNVDNLNDLILLHPNSINQELNNIPSSIILPIKEQCIDATTIYEYLNSNICDFLIISLMNNDPSTGNRKYLLSIMNHRNYWIKTYHETNQQDILIKPVSFLTEIFNLILRILVYENDENITSEAENLINNLIHWITVVPEDKNKLLMNYFRTNPEFSKLLHNLSNVKSFSYINYIIQIQIIGKYDLDHIMVLIPDLSEISLDYFVASLTRNIRDHPEIILKILKDGNDLLEVVLIKYLNQYIGKYEFEIPKYQNYDMIVSILDILGTRNNIEIRPMAIFLKKKIKSD